MKDDYLKFPVPSRIIPHVTINGRKFFYTKDKLMFQCAVCLWVMKIMPGENDNQMRKLYIDPFCMCSMEEPKDAGPIHAITPQEEKKEQEKPLRDRVKKLITD